MNRKLLSCAMLLLITQLGFGQIVNIPDPYFKDALVNQTVVDTDGDGTFDADADTNDDGEIDVQEALAVEVLGMVGKNIVSMEGLQEFINLRQLFAGYNFMEQIDVSALSQIEVLIVSFNLLDELDVSQNAQLKRLEFDFNMISSIDISQNPQLERLWFSFNSISSIDLSQHPALTSFNADSNQFESIDLSANPALTYLAIDNNSLSSIDLSANTQLEFVDVYANQLTQLDLSAQSNLDVLTCLNNNLMYLNIQNGNNEQMSFFNTQNNPNLSCIQVDDPDFANSQSDWLVDLGVSYSQDCMLLNTDRFESEYFGLAPNPSSGVVNVGYSNVATAPLNWTIFNSAGMVIDKFDGRPEQLDLSRHHTGIYFIQANDRQGRKYVQKLVVR